MRSKLSIRRLAAVVAVATVLFMSSCTAGSSKKYGCPNHLKAVLELVK